MIMIFVLSLLISFNVYGATYDQWKFAGKQDRFNINYEQRTYTIGNKEANMSVWNDFVQMFESELGDPCPTGIGSRDLKVTAINKGQPAKVREFYLEESVVKDPKTDKCTVVGGEGLKMLPMHRLWFIGQTEASLPTGKRYTFTQNDNVVIDFTFDNGQIESKLDNMHLDSFYAKQVLTAFKKFGIHNRMNLVGIDKFNNFKLKIGNQSYDFYDIGDGVWAVKYPKANWLLVSTDLGVLEDFNIAKWQDRHTGQLTAITDPKLPEAKRIENINKLGRSWSSAIKHAYHSILLDENDFVEVRRTVVKKLMYKPTNENMKVLANALSKTDDIELQRTITEALRIRNPKGKLISDDNIDEAAGIISDWKKWAKNLK